jgi:phosphatidylglycerophosphate synthase
MEKEDLNYFSEKEKKSMCKFKDSRNKIFLPISKVLMKLGLTANIISYIGLFMLMGFIYYVLSNPIVASIFLFLHVIIDAFDGPLARLMKQDGNSGAFTDIICDHTGMVIVIITLIWANLINPVIASVYIYVYTLLIIFVIARNKMNIPIKLVIRTKYYVYILFGMLAIWQINYLNVGLAIFTLAMLPSLLASYFIIKRHLK